MKMPVSFSSETPTLELCTVTLDQDTQTFKETKEYINHFVTEIFQITSRTTLLKYLSHFCTFPNWSHFLFVSNCSANHEHSRLLFVDKTTWEVTSFLDISGNLRSIWLSGDEIYIAKEQKNLCSFQKNSVWTNISNLPESQKALKYKCGIGEPWRRSASKKFKSSSKLILEKINKNGTNYHIFSESESYADPYEPLSYRKIYEMAGSLSYLVDFGNLTVTRDYIILNDTTRKPNSLIMGRNHQFEFQAYWSHCPKFVVPIFFHPTLPLVLTRANVRCNYKIHLLKTATKKDRQDFPQEEDCHFSYRQKISWKLNAD